jgi:hypothetical protein
MERHPRIEHEHVNPVLLDQLGQRLEGGAIEGCGAVNQGGEPQGAVAYRPEEEAATEIGLGDVVALADSGGAAVELVLFFLGV